MAIAGPACPPGAEASAPAAHAPGRARPLHPDPAPGQPRGRGRPAVAGGPHPGGERQQPDGRQLPEVPTPRTPGAGATARASSPHFRDGHVGAPPRPPSSHPTGQPQAARAEPPVGWGGQHRLRARPSHPRTGPPGGSRPPLSSAVTLRSRAVDLIRHGGKKMRFLVAKCDADTAQKVRFRSPPP